MPVALNAERQAKAREYARVRRRLMLGELGLSGLYIAAWVITGLNLILRDWLDGISNNFVIVVFLYGMVLAIPYTLFDLPLSYYGGYVLPHRYGQSNQTKSNWLSDQVKGMAIGGFLGFVVLEIIYGMLRTTPDMWWLYTAGVLVFFTVILASLAPVLIAPLFYKFSPLEDEELARRLVALAEKAGNNVRGVFRFDMSTRTKSANAALMGLGATRRIVLGDTLLDEFTHDEIETVLAHELGHHVHRDVVLGIVANSLLLLLSFWFAHLVLRWSIDTFGLDGIADPAGLPILLLVTGVVGLIAMPLSNAYSRWRERMADRYALESTRKPRAFSSAMTRLANQNLADANPERWVVILLYTHPPIYERIAVAEAFMTSHDMGV